MSERLSTDLPEDVDEPMADDSASDPGSDLELLAITEEYVAAQRAGKRPRLLDFVTRYPAHAAALADFVSQFQADEALGEGTRSAEDAPAGARPLSAGTRRALDALFGTPSGESALVYDPGYDPGYDPRHDAQGAPAYLPSVAETPAPYTPGGQGGGNDERPLRGGGDAAADDTAPSHGPTEDTKDTAGTDGGGRAPGAR